MFSYEKTDDNAYYTTYRISYAIVALVGIIGLLVVVFSLQDFAGLMGVLATNLPDILIVLTGLAVAALIVGWLQVAITSKLGEELILLVMWVTPFVVIAVSAYLYLSTNDTNLLGGAAAGLIFLALVFYFRKQVRLSARLIEVGAEITIKHPALFGPQLLAFIMTTVITILIIPGTMVLITYAAKISPILAAILAIIYEFLYLFVLAGIRAFADATNIAYVQQWYSGSNPSSSKAKDQVGNLKAPIVKFAFLMAFINRFRQKSSKFTPLTLFKFMDFRNWAKLLLGGRSVTSTAANVAAYFGHFTLIIIVTKKTKSITQAYKESAKSTFKSFAANIAGSIGFNILEGIRSWGSFLLLLALGGFYGYSIYSDLLIAVLMAFLFAILGMAPLNAMFKPVVNSYRLLLFNSYFGKSSSKIDKKTKEIIAAAIKK